MSDLPVSPSDVPDPFMGLDEPHPPIPPVPTQPDPFARIRKPHDPLLGVDDGPTARQKRLNKIEAAARKREHTVERQNIFAAHISAGMTIKDACKATPCAQHTYTNWRRTDVTFANRIDQIRARNLGAHAELEVDEDGQLHASVGWDGTFVQFRKHFFGYDTYAHQLQLVHAIEKMDDHEIGMVLLWPEAGKSTTLEDFICKQLSDDPNLRIVELSESGGLATKIVNRVKHRMTDAASFGPFIERYGPFYMDNQEREGKPWTANFIKVWKADSDERDYSLEARAITSSAYGSRIDLLIVDDCQSRKTLSQTASIVQHLRQTYFTRGRRMKIVFVGTRIAPGDVYETLLEEEGLIDWVVQLPAIRHPNDDEADRYPDGVPTAPEMWVVDPDDYEVDSTVPGFGLLERYRMIDDALESLAKIRKRVGEEVWYASYQQQPQNPGTATFPAEDIDACFDDTLKTNVYDKTAYKEASLDPALGGGNALLCAQWEHDKHPALRRLDLDYRFNLARVEQIITRIELMSARFNFQVLTVEQNAFQKSLANDERRLRTLAREHGFRVVPHDTGSNKSDQILGVASMATDIIQNNILFPGGDRRALAKFAPMRVQLLAWRPTIPTRLLRQDCVVTLWFQWRRWKVQQRSHEVESDTAWTREGMMPYAPTDARMILPTRTPLVSSRQP